MKVHKMEKIKTYTNKIMQEVALMNGKELTFFLTSICVFAITALRGLHGDEFVKGFLQAAEMDSEAKLVKTENKIH